MNREEALKLLKKEIDNPNLLKHMYACEAVMRALAAHFSEDEESWGLAGLLHDIDYEKTAGENFRYHGTVGAEMLREMGFSAEIAHAVAAHNPESGAGFDTLMDKCLYSCDPITGLVVAAALIRPEKSLLAVDVSSLAKRYQEKGFARGANRAQIATCGAFGMELEDFFALALSAMQGIHQELGL